eukprot:scaffold29181_cov17-Tisochrysis_lutea.AAC.1
MEGLGVFPSCLGILQESLANNQTCFKGSACAESKPWLYDLNLSTAAASAIQWKKEFVTKTEVHQDLVHYKHMAVPAISSTKHVMDWAHC